MRLRPDNDRSLFPTHRRPERPLPYAIALGILGGVDFILMYRMAETPIEFLILLFLLACTFVLAIETLSRLD